MAGRGSRESCGLRRDLRWLPEFASESGSADTPKHSTQTRARHQLSPRIIARARILLLCGVSMSAGFSNGSRSRQRHDGRPLFSRRGQDSKIANQMETRCRYQGRQLFDQFTIAHDHVRGAIPETRILFAWRGLASERFDLGGELQCGRSHGGSARRQPETLEDFSSCVGWMNCSEHGHAASTVYSTTLRTNLETDS